MALNTVQRWSDRTTTPNVWLALALSLLLHGVALWGWMPRVVMKPSEDAEHGKPGGPLAVRLAPPPGAERASPPKPVIQAHPAQMRRTHPHEAAQRPPSEPRVIALIGPLPSSATAPAAEAARPPVQNDLASYIEARRRARESTEGTPPSRSESEQELHNRAVATSLGLNRTPATGSERERGGGVFQIARMGRDDAEYFFFGWNKDIRRNSQQMIGVRRGDTATMEIAVVRSMIAIIREHESRDFTWESERLGRSVSLSARAADNAALEDFLMRDFFPASRLR